MKLIKIQSLTCKQIILNQAETCKNLGHLYLADYLNNLCSLNLPEILNNLEFHKNSLKHYPYAFLVLTDLIAVLS